MRFQLDTGRKTIKVEEEVKLSKFFSIIKRILPNGEWQDFTLQTNTVIEHWSSPIVLKEYYPVPSRPWWQAPWYERSGTYMAVNNGGETDLSMHKADLMCSNNSIKENFKAVANNAVELKDGTFNIEA